ncbi:unnamed protein product, partial [Closterium sp. Naga37s-1]
WEDSANRMRDKAPKGWWTGYILRVTTHLWFNKTVSTRFRWWHWMTVIAPDDMHNAHKGLVLFVIGSGWSPLYYHHMVDKDEMFTAAFAPYRVVGMVAYGFDLLDFGRNFQHLHDSLGAWPVILKFYATFNVTSQLQSPQFQRLTEDTDPYYFRERLTMPKLLVSAANDEVLALDDTYIWWNDMPEPKLLKIMANSEHMGIHINKWANQATLSFLASLLHVNSSCAALPASSRPSLTWTRPSNARNYNRRRRKHFDRVEGTGLFAREERKVAEAVFESTQRQAEGGRNERKEAEAQAGGGRMEGIVGGKLTNQEQPAHPWVCVPELPAVDWPKLRWRFDWSTFTIHATSDRKPLAVRA